MTYAKFRCRCGVERDTYEHGSGTKLLCCWDIRLYILYKRYYKRENVCEDSGRDKKTKQ